VSPLRSRQRWGPDQQGTVAPESSASRARTDVPFRLPNVDRGGSIGVDLDEIDWESCLRGLGDTLRKLRTSAGISQRELARVSGVSQGAVSRFEAGRRRAIPAHVMLKIAVALARQPATRDQPMGEAVRHLLDALVLLVLAGQSS
jgi:DNA-binding XRE family transcriptional regulator